jgi:hypothetical protein
MLRRKDLIDPELMLRLINPERTIQGLIEFINTLDEKISALDSILSRTVPSAGTDYHRYDTPTLLGMFITSDDVKALEEAVTRIMKEEQCSFCRVMASAAYMEAKTGNIDRAKGYAKEVYRFLTESSEGDEK